MQWSLPTGETAALTASLLWSFSSILLAAAGRRIGSLAANRWRLVFSSLFLLIMHLAFTGHLLPQMSGDAALWLAASGVVGLALGDTFLFRTFVILGPRIGMVIMTLSPVFATLMAQIFLGERLTSTEHLGIVIVVAGVSWAVIHRPPQKTATAASPEGSHLWGIVAGVLASIGQATGLILARQGLSLGATPLGGNLVRMSSALFVMWGFLVVAGKLPSLLRTTRDKTAMRNLTVASALGPTLGVWLSLLAIQYAPVGIASTLMSLSPILLIPLSHFLLKERIHPQSVVGTGIAVLGVALLVG